jgi:hypothetical protein
MPNITVITPPDKIFNTNKSILLIYPNNSLKSDFQTLVQDWEVDFNLYLYSVEPTEQDHDWLLSIVKLVDIVIFDVDNATAEVRDLASYIIAHPHTYWLTNSPSPVYNKLSVNRIYDLSFLKQGDITNGI